MDWTEMSEMSSPNSGKHPSYKRTGSKDSMEVIFLIEKGNFEFCRSFILLNLTSDALEFVPNSVMFYYCVWYDF